MSRLTPIIKFLLPVLDVLLIPITFLSALSLKGVRRAGVHRMPVSRAILRMVGVFPIRRHYYEPLFHPGDLTDSLQTKRALPGIDFNASEQVELVKKFSYTMELEGIPFAPTDDLTFHFKNRAFESGDAEFLYNFIRLKRPRKIYEIGSGNSTLMARRAIAKNKEDDARYECDHVCIEPYEAPWLEKTGVCVIRKMVQEVDKSLFKKLNEGDMLFIDSSHMVRPQGDVLFEYLEILPILNPGVIVHVHDVFTPRDYLREWIVDEVRFWNEQYILEAFLTHNDKWKVIAALNYLRHEHFDLLKEKCPYLTLDRDPGSFYIQKNA